MAYQDVLQFWQRVQTDTNFQNTLRSVNEQTEEKRPGAVAAIAQQAGFSVDADELKAMESALGGSGSGPGLPPLSPQAKTRGRIRVVAPKNSFGM